MTFLMKSMVNTFFWTKFLIDLIGGTQRNWYRPK